MASHISNIKVAVIQLRFKKGTEDPNSNELLQVSIPVS